MGDIVALWGTIGTWVAVALASIALIGIVSPWLVLRAARSERNRALNAVQDSRQDYVTKGIGFSRNIRFRRKTKVPDLTPNYDAPRGRSPLNIPVGSGKPADPVPYLRLDEFMGRLEDLTDMSKWRGTTCRTGWAKFCRLESYNGVYDDVKNTRGKLVVYQGRTWLPVSRYWILVVGLLGRYGHYQSHVLGGCREDLDAYQIGQLGSDCGSDTTDRDVVHIYRRPLARESSDNFSITSSVRGHSDDQASSGDSSRRTHRHHNHTQVPPEPPRLYRAGEMRGLTGSFKKIALSKWGTGLDTLTAPLQFEIRTSDQVSFRIPLSDMIWLATGFIPIRSKNSGSGSNPEVSPSWVACLQDPSEEPAVYDQDIACLHEYRISQGIPRFLHQMMRYLAIPDVPICNMLEPPSKEKLKVSQVSLNEWVPLPQWPSYFLRRSELEAVVDTMLRLPWDGDNYLVWKSTQRFWHGLLRKAITFLDQLPLLSRTVSSIGNWEVQQWKEWNRFEPSKTAYLLELGSHLKSAHNQPAEVQIAISVLFITNDNFHAEVASLLDQKSGSISEVTAAFEVKTGKLSWEHDGVGKVFFITPRLVRVGKRITIDDTIELKSTDVLLMALWSATRCALWRGAPSSKPLLQFIKSMESVAHIM